eukprot:CAMPEP_0180290438 /NCGR_PEP_ID=MMETSP0988-20121125/15436_1 /TAXON_ID=697907 /ORGANISM="non described non described, Strain CCMP2293" /LENGTH=118 /DNA_ID=CAMNT_0022265891 /DNA_START=488 /DNA_END=841 /DNA_ORIENTATION=-
MMKQRAVSSRDWVGSAWQAHQALWSGASISEDMRRMASFGDSRRSVMKSCAAISAVVHPMSPVPEMGGTRGGAMGGVRWLRSSLAYPAASAPEAPAEPPTAEPPAAPSPAGWCVSTPS